MLHGMHPVQAAPRQRCMILFFQTTVGMHPVQAAPRQRTTGHVMEMPGRDAPCAGSAEAKRCGRSSEPCCTSDAPRAGSAEAKFLPGGLRYAIMDAPRAGSAEAKVLGRAL